ncbi:MAG: c-type cytochrome [Alphaproteobacteria bacterium]|nr:c-type cytochrome [Alphaproteobacteria bacterium]
MPSNMLRNTFTLFLVVLALTTRPGLAQVGPSDQVKTINSILPAPFDIANNWQRFYIATEFGLLRTSPNGLSELMPAPELGLTGMAASPANANLVLASGFTRDAKTPTMLKSTDGGTSWQVLPGAETTLRAITFSPENPEIVYALSRELNISRDGGATWQTTGTLPGDVFNLAVSAQSPETLFAATMKGLMRSDDGGDTWQKAYDSDKPTTMVNVDKAGQITAYVYSVGLITRAQSEADWQVLTTEFDQRYILNFLKDAQDPNLITVTVDTAAILLSRDGGRNWASFEGSQRDTPENIAKGATLFADNCQACHGINAIGEVPGNPEAKDEFGFKAPALNDDAHGWHHSDGGIKATISKGSARNERMIAWQEILSEDDISNLVTYLKSNWSLNSLACQGGRHMVC